MWFETRCHCCAFHSSGWLFYSFNNTIMCTAGCSSVPQRSTQYFVIWQLELNDGACICLLVRFDVGLSSLWKAKHPTHHTAAVQTPTQVAHLPPSPSMLHFHHTLRDEALFLCSHEDGTKTDFFYLHLAVTLSKETQCTYDHMSVLE